MTFVVDLSDLRRARIVAAALEREVDQHRRAAEVIAAGALLADGDQRTAATHVTRLLGTAGILAAAAQAVVTEATPPAAPVVEPAAAPVEVVPVVPVVPAKGRRRTAKAAAAVVPPLESAEEIRSDAATRARLSPDEQAAQTLATLRAAGAGPGPLSEDEATDEAAEAAILADLEGTP